MHTLTFHFSGDALAVGAAATALAHSLADGARERFVFGEPPMAWEGEVRVLTLLCDAGEAAAIAELAQQAHDASTCALAVRGVPPVAVAFDSPADAAAPEAAADAAPPVKRRR